MKNKKSLGVYLILALCLIFVCVPRFNRKDLGFIKNFTSGGKCSSHYLEDAGHYIRYVEFFRGIPIARPIPAPITYRLFVPFVASLLPFDPMTAINILNIFSLLAGLFFLNLLLRYLQFSFSRQVIGSLLFIFSFPPFYYGAIGYIDPVVICFLTLGVYLIVTEKWLPLLLLFILSAFVKETLIILLPVTFTALLYHTYPWKKKISLFLGLSLSFLVTYQIIRLYNPAANSFFWWPSTKFLFGNMHRFKNWGGGFILGFGLPGFISLGAFSQFTKSSPNKKIWLAPLLTGLVMALALYIYALCSAYVDARFIWTSYPFSIPLALFVLDPIMQKFMTS